MDLIIRCAGCGEIIFDGSKVESKQGMRHMPSPTEFKNRNGFNCKFCDRPLGNAYEFNNIGVITK